VIAVMSVPHEFIEYTKGYVFEKRPLELVRKIVVKGSSPIVFRRMEKSTFIVAGETADAVASVVTRCINGKLVIERKGMLVTMIGKNGALMNFYGPISQVAGRFVIASNGQIASGGQIVSNGQSVNLLNSNGNVVICIGLPEMPPVKIDGSADITLLDLHQENIDIKINGSSDIVADGKVSSLDLEINGSGDIDVEKLIAEQGNLSIFSSGTIDAFIRSKVHARIAGSGNITVRGNPPQRDHCVAGSGKIKFK
jgi:hypothetical protein